MTQHKIDMSNTSYGEQLPNGLTFEMKDFSDFQYPDITITSHDRTQQMAISFSSTYDSRLDSISLTGRDPSGELTKTIEITGEELEKDIAPEYIDYNLYTSAKGSLIFCRFQKKIINHIGNELTTRSLHVTTRPTFFQGTTLKGLGRIYNYHNKDKKTVALFNTLLYKDNVFSLQNVSTKLTDLNEVAFDFIPMNKIDLVIKSNSLFKIINVSDNRNISVNNDDYFSAIQTGGNSSYKELAMQCGAMSDDTFQKESQNYLANFKSEENRKKEEEELIGRLLF